MRLSGLMIVNTIVAGVFGLAFLFAPTPVMGLYSTETGPTLDLMCQLFGAALIGFAVLSWVARNAPDSEARRAIVLAFFFGDLIGCIVALIAQFGGVVNALGWTTVGIYFLLAVGFGYFTFSAPTAASGTPGSSM